MKSKPDKFQQILDSSDFYEVQIIYTQVNRDLENKPSFKSFYFNLDSGQYFYPASTVKLPAVLLALEKLRALNVQHLDKYTPMLHDSVYSGQSSVQKDTTSANSMASVAHYAKKILVASDNDAFNRLYEFIGQENFNKELRKKGYTDTRILHRLERALSLDENAHTEAIRFFQKHGVVYEQPMLMNETPYAPSTSILKGKGYIKKDTLVSNPFDFTYKNFFPLDEQQRMMQAIIFPETVPAESRFVIPEEDRAFVLQYMSQLPTETTYPPYNQDDYYTDAYCKFFMFGGNGAMPKNIRIFNKVGDAYGYLIDNAYIVDFGNNIEFMLSAVIHVNKDGIYNDGKYEYESIGQPFFKNIGNLIYEYELSRIRQHQPDLSAFKFEYEISR
ncbi:hypothetical protein SanaruYs_38250 [Chryseotalea sanaruensis]|uniref:Beta-lactamase class A catalytic domain-containing protein n=2 Tax=Chryseotalea sanaruensis TaxID=2482724 RepID=A0A401UFF5_9BACT|nr:hypothetical protein SanaruYs_38250 [Chryseotalea sanaruensis]